MENDQLNYTRQYYFTGPSSTELHTVDVWRPESVPIGQEDKEKLWLMLVNMPPFLETVTE
jgi:hypothetical protein